MANLQCGKRQIQCYSHIAVLFDGADFPRDNIAAVGIPSGIGKCFGIRFY